MTALQQTLEDAERTHREKLGDLQNGRRILPTSRGPSRSKAQGIVTRIRRRRFTRLGGAVPGAGPAVPALARPDRGPSMAHRPRRHARGTDQVLCVGDVLSRNSA